MRLGIACMALSAVLLPLPGLADDNLRQCLDGRYPALCDASKLTPAQREQAASAERKANLKACLDGRYPALCNHSLLTSDERTLVQRSEYRENLKVCLAGKYSALCHHDWLSDAQREQVQDAEKRENLQICLSGKYQALCRHELLSASEAAAIVKIEQAHPMQSARAKRTSRPAGGISGCESGHWIEEVMSDGEIIKLEDGSLWEVDATDTVDSALWLPVSDVVVCDDKIINTDDNETVGVTRLR